MSAPPRLSARLSVLDQKKSNAPSPTSPTGLKTSLGMPPNSGSSGGGGGLKSSVGISSLPTIPSTKSTSPTLPKRNSANLSLLQQQQQQHTNKSTSPSSNTPTATSTTSPFSYLGKQASAQNLNTMMSMMMLNKNPLSPVVPQPGASLFYATPTEADDEEFEHIRNLLNSEYSVTTVQSTGALKSSNLVVMSWKNNATSELTEQDDQLENDKRDLQFIKEQLEKNNSMSKQMIYILDRFNEGLSQLEMDVAPINASMNEWSSIFNNINSTMEQVKSVLDKFDVDKIDSKINDGAKGDYVSYMLALEHVGNAIDYIAEKSHFKSSDKVMDALKQLKATGLNELETSFKSLLLKISNLVDPTTIAKLPNSKRYLAIILPNHVEEISKYIELFEKLHYNAFLKEYKDKRSKFILLSLRKMAPEKFIKQTSETKNLAYVKGSHPLISYVQETLRLYQIEYDLASELFGNQYQLILDEIIDPAHELLLETTEPIIKVRKTPGDKIFSIFPLLDLFDTFTKLLPDFITAISSRDGKHISELKTQIKHLQDTCASLLDFSLDEEKEISSSNRKEIISDATVDEISSNMINYFKRLIEYKHSVELLLKGQDNNNSNSNSNAPSSTSSNSKSSSSSSSSSSSNSASSTILPTSFIGFLEKILKNLIKYLQGRAKKDFPTQPATDFFKPPIKSVIFQINNYHYISTSLKQSKILSNQQFENNELASANHILHEFETCLDNEIKVLNSFWKTIADILITNKSNKEKDEVKSIIKKHTNFLKTFNDLNKLKFDIPDQELKLKLKTEAKNIIGRSYDQFKELCRLEKIHLEKNFVPFETTDDINRKLDRVFDSQ
ncbi:exocyst complex subunit 7 [Dictyostelium discoideum AX4]|uniref:Exocyst complex component 7 n=1 Tax=Dictyostelium discoideum TaxID=44689 RepID=EXOC7_DICDI|nr:exocyst complex subunit 7 [Dictyostelium discoideum AX4]Q558Z9.1 RecName: Full=Exocyst complex component 7; AltName: Full=Exocyst complex component Exo70 [Dictyostelium discoideum]EAL71133.1 exocyst complex subunit 7 [Dictyostelium discoideum AX4]|eukprot:XP_644917.1 exocyst complex subunit 7 [Dictyostelium discoideum AX4]